jgi:hypothetical protein|tara:strand:+ start:19 stop:339 length:321 start_codon:yes stop_codon:yes gene_type:complete
MAQNVNLRGLEGNMQAQPRMFAHDAVGLTAAQITSGTYTIPNSDTRGVCLFVGVKMASITVTMESGRSVVFKGVAAGSFMPVLVTSVTTATPDSGALADNDIVALY